MFRHCRQPLFFIFLLLLLLSVFVRARLANLPLERDSGEYAYAGQMILNGCFPYADFYNMKFPGVYFIYALILLLLGQTTFAIHIALTIIHCANTLLVMWISRQWLGEKAGWFAGSMYLLLLLPLQSQGLIANAEHFALLFALPSILLLSNESERFSFWKIFLSGMLISAAVLMKQHAIFFLLFGILCLLLFRKSSFSWQGDLMIFILGTLVPIATMLAYVAQNGAWEQFIFFTFIYACEYTAITTLSEGLNNFNVNFSELYHGLPSLWWIAGAALILLLILGFFRRDAWKLSLLTICSLAAISVGLYFREHYFILAYPALALVSAYSLVFIPAHFGWKKISSLASITLIVPAGWLLFSQGDFFLKSTPDEVIREMYPWAPFAEAKIIGEHIVQRTPVSAKIGIIGSEPEILFYARRISATKYIYLYPLLEKQPFAEKMTADFLIQMEESKPEFVVLSSWNAANRTTSAQLLSWWKNYRADYVPEGVFYIKNPWERKLQWCEDEQCDMDTEFPSLKVYRRAYI